ncbi:MAG TPA: RNA polymerase sigma factor [Candidatus Polarisedimenticolaceae bacterium]|nr:RNA polymerase sigma factor [Candidatus Polarisedimenticolaceae bacterium]
MSKDTNKEEAVQALSETRPAPEPLAAASVAAIFEEHHQHVYRVARRITGCAEDAEDVMQTVFLRVTRREPGELRSEELASYLHRAATNAALDLLRRRKTARSEPLGDFDRFRDQAPDPEARHEGAELRARVRASLATLSPRAAEIFVLRYFDGYGNREIARLLNTSWSTVAVTLHRTRAKLQKDLKGDLR